MISPRERYILTDYPQIKVMQIQFNYLDYNDPAVQSRRCYEVCRKFGKPVIVMEPVKGGNLVNLPDDARAVLDGLRGGGPASYAIRFAAGFPGMLMVLSGMSSLSQMEDNIAFMRDFRPLDERALRHRERHPPRCARRGRHEGARHPRQPRRRGRKCPRPLGPGGEISPYR